MKTRVIDAKSFIIGALAAALLFATLGAGSDSFSPDETARLKNFTRCLQADGNINLGKRKIIMQGSSIYDDGSESGGLILRGGASRIHLHGDSILDGNIHADRETVKFGANLDMGNKKIIMLGSRVYDDGSEGGGLILRGGAKRIHLHGDSILDGNIRADRETVKFGANLDMGDKKIIMLGSSIYDNGSEGGGLILRGGASRIHLFGKTITH